MKRTILVLAAVSFLMGCSGGSSGTNVAPETSNVYFGDLHGHSTFSAPGRVGNATPEDFYRVARDDIKLDFVALSDHDIFLTSNEWAASRQAAQMFNEPGAFVAFSAIEWTHDWHMNTIFRRDDEEICDCSQSSAYYDHHREVLESRDAAGQLNHPTNEFLPDWSTIDDTLSKNVEVFNAVLDLDRVSGDQEFGLGGAIWSLRAGFRFGFVAVSDDHMSDVVPPLLGNGITGCHARELTREAIIDALHDRRCYGSTRERIIVDTEIAGVPMGGIATADIGAIVSARVTITATATPVEIELVLNGDTVATRHCNERSCQLESQIRVDDPSNFVYARIHQPDDQRAWSSPVWIHATCPDEDEHCLDQRLVPGDDGETDCLAEFLFPASARPSTYRASPAAIICEDGDPECDFAENEGICAIPLGLCFAVADSRLPGCTANRADGFEVIQPSAEAQRPSADWQNRLTLEAIFQAAHTSNEKNGCSGNTRMLVRAGEKRTIHFATSAAGQIDQDSLTIECLKSQRGD